MILQDVTRIRDEYELAVYYMAQTELFDRGLTDLRSPYDQTEAFPIGIERRLSLEFAGRLRRQIGPINIRDEIKKHADYSAQRWVDEYYRIFR